MSQPATAPDHQSSGPTPPPFDPTQPAVPISYPIKTLEELESRSYFKSFHYPFNKSTVPLQSGSPSLSLPDRPRVIVCHDMAGGYGDDKWIQGGTNPNAYAIWHWYLIDIFIYFSHSLVTLPPPCWTNTAHRHGVKVLGTFITEGDEGKLICNKLLSTKESAEMYAEFLAELAVALGFDGWLINMEVKLNSDQVPNLKAFVSHLTQTTHSSVPGSLVIWYDSVTADGELYYQNQLNEKNKPFFDICDGIFVNYIWEENYPRLSAAVAGNRKYDVYMGIDVFGRGTFGGGQWNTSVALDVLKKDDVSTAIFAPGWIYETKQPPNFQIAQNHWWSLVEKSWGVVQNYPKVLPFYTNFDQGYGYHVSVDGEQVSDASWCNISSQGLQPFLEFSGNATPDGIQVHVDFKEASYSGGGNITFKGNLEDSDNLSTRLFLGDLLLGDSPLHFTYSVISENNSQLGLHLIFSSTPNERKSKPEFNERILKSIAEEGTQNSTEYYAVLGHISIKTGGQTSDFPPSDSWLVEGEYIKWTTGSEGSKTVSLKITWKLKDGNDYPATNYNIYVEKLAKGALGHPGAALERVHEYIGAARVEAFYVDDLAVPSGTSDIKFIVQVCGTDGSNQKLDDSPVFLLEAAALANEL
ncbi:cytosolic endo-beta-N-acetylglucosaminidase 1 isoform X2 [Pyrus x bretschneideri]|uniref:cytosolic endo-beta-N-acetylglucosaminidase 1 isoform X2 n=1 Tax=Pyrus x bretschneideri TaxID=225117 RepID=UPI002030BCC2|nr:cytosolic endo-beta-N-acetylglucosaminidase 1 isoform X2 [Pyrus x bretschneideri]